MSDTPESPAQAYIVTAHLAAGRTGLAAIAAALPASYFREADRLLERAFVAGMAAALTALENQNAEGANCLRGGSAKHACDDDGRDTDPGHQPPGAEASGAG